MATKNLSRTVIEGGRGNQKWERSTETRAERHAQKIQNNQMSRDPDLYDDGEEVEPRRVVYPNFHDKLGPLKRWVESKVGKSWNKTYSAVREKFDIRTTPGRHIVEGHLMADITEYGEDDRYSKYSKFKVDKNGILRKNTGHARYQHRKQESVNKASVYNWMEDRLIGRLPEGALFWFVPNTVQPSRFIYVGYPYFTYMRVSVDKKGNPVYREHTKLDGRGLPYKVQEPVTVSNVGWRQDKRLSKEEAAFFEKLPEWFKEEILQRSPVYREDKKSA